MKTNLLALLSIAVLASQIGCADPQEKEAADRMQKSVDSQRAAMKNPADLAPKTGTTG